MENFVIGKDNLGNDFHFSDLNDGKYYEVSNLLNVLSNLSFNVRGNYEWDVMDSKDSLIKLILDARNGSDNFYIDDNETDFVVGFNENHMRIPYIKDRYKIKDENLDYIFNKYKVSNEQLKNEKIVLKYDKENNLFIEPLSGLKIGVYSFNTVEKFNRTTDGVEALTSFAQSITPVVTEIFNEDDIENGHLTGIKEASLDDVSKNKKWADYLKYYDSFAHRTFDNSLSKLVSVEEELAKVDDYYFHKDDDMKYINYAAKYYVKR